MRRCDDEGGDFKRSVSLNAFYLVDDKDGDVVMGSGWNYLSSKDFKGGAENFY